MEHLTIDEITDFVLMDSVDEKCLILASKVNTHIGHCRECFEKVRAVQSICDNFANLSGLSDGFESCENGGSTCATGQPPHGDEDDMFM